MTSPVVDAAGLVGRTSSDPLTVRALLLGRPAACVAVVGDTEEEIEGDGVPAGAAQGAGGARSAPGHLRPAHPQQRPLRRPPPRKAGKVNCMPLQLS